MAPPIATDVHLEAISDTQAILIASKVPPNADTHAIFTIDDVLPHRQASAPIPGTIAAFASSNAYKSKGCFSKPGAKRWDHRISLESSARKASSLKGAAVHLKKPGIISLGGGLPSSDYFPFENFKMTVPISPAFSEAETATTGQELIAGKHDIKEGKSIFDLEIALNYSQATGTAQMLRFVIEHTEVVHNPPYSDWECCLTAGSTLGLEMIYRLLCERGDYFLTEEYAFATAIETATPLGIKAVGVKMDDQGLLPQSLDHILSAWDPISRGARKPCLLYTVPTGQNPSGATQGFQRRKDIYAVAEKHDLLILEDEPYFFLQMDDYHSGSTHEVASPFKPTPVKDFLSALIPSYLSIDVSGRVLRLDSFSKIIAPGARLGWVTASSQLIERFIRHQEVSAQNPAGMSQIILFKLLDEGWGHKGFLDWLMYIRAEYTRRRDVIVNACERFLPREVCCWTPPAAGMFMFIKVDWRLHPELMKQSVDEILVNELLELEDRVFLQAVEEGTLVSKGSWFRAEKGTDRELYFRFTFAAASAENIELAVRRFGKAIRREFGIKDTENNHTNISEIGIKGTTNGTNGHATPKPTDLGKTPTTHVVEVRNEIPLPASVENHLRNAT